MIHQRYGQRGKGDHIRFPATNLGVRMEDCISAAVGEGGSALSLLVAPGGAAFGYKWGTC